MRLLAGWLALAVTGTLVAPAIAQSAVLLPAGLMQGVVETTDLNTGPAAAPRLSENVDVLSGTLTLDRVLRSSATQFPAILAAIAERRAAEGDLISARGAFDTVFDFKGSDRVSGTWTGGFLNGEVRQNLRPFGAKVYGGYRISDGTFPIYENIENTNQGGEARIGALFSLLRDRAIDPRRFGLLDTELALNQADLEILLTRIGVQHKALRAYWQWVAAGHQLKIYEDLLRIALERESGLEEQVRRGARARIFLTENQQNITRRRRLVMQAEGDFRAAANALSFYYRDSAGTPVTPERGQLPARQNMDAERVPDPDGDTAIANALLRRPELEILSTAIDRAEAKIALSENELKPRLDLNAEVSSDFGAVGAGGSTFDSTDTKIGLRFTVPFQRREAKGKLRAAKAKREATFQKRRQTQDMIERDLRDILINLDVAREIARLARREVAQARTMQNAERERFAAGASDFFLVNIREETTADAEIRALLADLQTRLAEANYAAATVNLDRLGIREADGF